MRLLLLILVSTVLLGISGCDSDARSARGFSLPAGDSEAGEVVFTAMKCNSCHSLPNIDQLEGTQDLISVKLGGKVSISKTYGQLVTSVINPSHRIAKSYQPQNTDAEGQSMMRNYNDVMTVKQLVDLVTFLESQYELKPYPRSPYPVYYPQR
ncbi:MAG: c-type cytochrome [Halioglobus sp.]